MRANNDKTHLRVRQLRIALALLGLMAALFGSRLIPAFQNGDNVLVWVNEEPITADQLAFAEQRLTADSGNSLTEIERRSIVELLINEELLLQRAQSTGTFAADPAVRKAIVQAVIDKIVADFQRHPVSSQQLRQFYQQHANVFERPARIAVEALRFETYSSAKQAYTALLAGAQFDEVTQAEAATPIAHLPSSPLPIHMLRRYLGNALTEIALMLDEGEVSDPVVRPDGVYLLKARVVQRAVIQRFEEVRDKVAAEYEFRGREIALEQEVARLWMLADININDRVAREYKVPQKYSRDLYSLIDINNNESGDGL